MTVDSMLDLLMLSDDFSGDFLVAERDELRMTKVVNFASLVTPPFRISLAPPASRSRNALSPAGREIVRREHPHAERLGGCYRK
jgi:hypothetical protein